MLMMGEIILSSVEAVGGNLKPRLEATREGERPGPMRFAAIAPKGGKGSRHQRLEIPMGKPPL